MAKRKKSRRTPPRNAKGRFVKRGGAPKAARKASRKVSHRKAVVHRKRHAVKRHRKVWSVASHTAHARRSGWMSNPNVMSFGGIGSELMTVGVLFGTLFAAGFIARQAAKLPLPANKWVSLAEKLGVALLGAYGVRYLARRNLLSQRNATVATATMFVPLGMGLLNEFIPAVASQVQLAGAQSLNAELGGMYPQELGTAFRSAPAGLGLGAELEGAIERDSEMAPY